MLVIKLCMTAWESFRRYDNNTTLDLAAVADPSELLELDEDEPKHTADMGVLFIFVMVLADTRKSQFCALVSLTGPCKSN